jgi:uncharacterized delta-60 repeat protein
MIRSAFVPARFVAVIVVAVLLCAFPAVASASPGQVDPTFGHLGNGTVWSDHGPGDFIAKVLRQPDGKIVTVAEVTNKSLIGVLVVTRYLANGALDPTFGTGGHFAKESALSGNVTDAVLQPDGKIVVVGLTRSFTSPTSPVHEDFFIMRLLPNGKVDPSFVTPQPGTSFPGTSVAEAFGVALGPAGTIVVAGRVGENIAVARYTSTGALDPTFSGDGRVIQDFGGDAQATDVAVQGDGKIIVGGVADNGTAENPARILLARFDTNGTLDSTYGTGGRVTTTGAPVIAVSNVLLQGTEVVIAGIGNGTHALARYNVNGTLDTTFGSGGKTLVHTGAVTLISDLVADGSGRLLLAGEAATADTLPSAPTVSALLRFSANGAPDLTFGCNGMALTEMLGNGAGTTYIEAAATSVAVDGNQIVVAGWAEAFDFDVPMTDGFVARYDGDGPHTSGYALLRSNGGTSSFGGAGACGSMAGVHLNAPIVGTALDPVASGNWTVASDGGIVTFGRARFFGSTGALHLNQPIVGMAATPDGKGYWLVARDGGVFAFGSARFFGSTGATKLNQPIVGMAAAHDGKGYWLVGRDGGVFAFGSAKFAGSTGSLRLNRPIVGMAADPDGTGYWLVASDGGIFAFAAKFSGSTGSIKLHQPVVGIAADPDGTGYWMAARDGGVFAFAAKFLGSTGATSFPAGSVRSTIGIAATP